MTKQTAHLENWFYNEAWNCLHGTVSGHPKLGDEVGIRTSSVLKIDYEKRTAETRNTLYTLGEPAMMNVQIDDDAD